MQPDASNSSCPLYSMWGATEVIFLSLTPTSAISFRSLAGSITLPFRIIKSKGAAAIFVKGQRMQKTGDYNLRLVEIDGSALEEIFSSSIFPSSTQLQDIFPSNVDMNINQSKLYNLEKVLYTFKIKIYRLFCDPHDC